MNQIYTDKDVLSDALTIEKTSTCNYNTYSNECVHNDVRETMLNILSEEHDIQNDVFNMMHQRGYYPTPSAEADKIEQTKAKFSNSIKMS